MNYSKARKAMTQDSAYSTKRKPTKRKKKADEAKSKKRKPRSRTY